MKNLILIFVIAFTIFGCSVKKDENIVRKEYYAKPVTELKLENFHQVDDKIYRSAQPNKEEFMELYKFGIRYDLNLRQWHDDKDELVGTPIKNHHIKINTSKMTYSQLVEAVSYLAHSDAKTLVHCLHGSDRTGTVIAGYRIAVQGWSKEKAIDEFVNGGFGYHAFFFPNLVELLDSLDIEVFKHDVYK